MNDVRSAEPPFVSALSHAEADPFRLLVEAVKDYGIFMLDPAGNVTSWNPGAEKSKGYNAEEIIGHHVSCFYTPEDVALGKPQRGLQTALKEGHFEEEGLRVRKGGATFWAVVTITNVHDSFGRHIGFANVTRDITPQKKADESLTRSEERYRRLFEAAQDGILIVDEVSRRVIDANPFLADLLGYNHDELIGKELWEIGFFRDIESNKAEFRALQEKGYIRYDDLPLSTQDGRRIDVEFVSNVYDVGDTRVIQCNIRDISARKRAEDAFRLRDRAIQAVTQGILISDPSQPDNPIIYASPGSLRLTGYAAEEVIGRNCRFLQGKDTDLAAVACLREAFRAGETCTVELRNYRKDGTPFWNELSISPVRDADGRLTHFVGVQVDVTARRSLEEQYRQAQKMDAIGRLAGGVAHDFNNLLTIINGYSELVLGSLPASDPLRELMGSVIHAGERAAGLTRQLLAFSRKAIIEPKVLDLKVMVIDVERMLRRIVGEDIDLAVAGDPEVGAVRADPGQVEQVIMNLVVNARDAMPQGGRITIEVRNADLDEIYTDTHPDARVGPHILLAVTDTGCGMDSATIARVFEPFFTTKGEHGTGLGLATVHGIVKQAGGHVAVSSEVGHGSTFKVYLPRIQREPIVSESRRSLFVIQRGGETILLVEDEDGVRALTRHVLRSSGYMVLEARNGAEAVRIGGEHQGPIDLLVTDVVMPRMSGGEVAKFLKAIHPGIKVLFLSGYTDDEVVRHGILEAEVAFLQKPFTPTSLAGKVREVLDTHDGG